MGVIRHKQLIFKAVWITILLEMHFQFLFSLLDTTQGGECNKRYASLILKHILMQPMLAKLYLEQVLCWIWFFAFDNHQRSNLALALDTTVKTQNSHLFDINLGHTGFR